MQDKGITSVNKRRKPNRTTNLENWLTWVVTQSVRPYLSFKNKRVKSYYTYFDVGEVRFLSRRRRGNEVAKALVRWAGEELGDLALGVIRQLHLEEMAFEVVLAGSFFKGSLVVERETMKVVHEVAPQAEIVRLDALPVVGGELLGMEKAGLGPWRLRKCLIETTRAKLSVQEGGSVS